MHSLYQSKRIYMQNSFYMYDLHILSSKFSTRFSRGLSHQPSLFIMNYWKLLNELINELNAIGKCLIDVRKITINGDDIPYVDKVRNLGLKWIIDLFIADKDVRACSRFTPIRICKLLVRMLTVPLFTYGDVIFSNAL